MLRACMVPKPEQQDPGFGDHCASWRCRPESLSAAQLAELLDPTVRQSVADIRAFLRAHQDAVFQAGAPRWLRAGSALRAAQLKSRFDKSESPVGLALRARGRRRGTWTTTVARIPGQQDAPGRPETAETHVVWFITQRRQSVRPPSRFLCQE